MTRPRDKLVTSLIDRLTSRLPYRTGIDASDLSRDSLFTLTRATLTQVSEHDISATIAALGTVLDELSTQFGPVRARPDFVLQSELHVVELLADCCAAHWRGVRRAAAAAAASSSSSGSTPDDDDQPRPGGAHRRTRSSPNEAHDAAEVERVRNNHRVVPSALADAQVMHLLQVLTLIITPIADERQMPTSSLLDLGFLPAAGSGLAQSYAGSDAGAAADLEPDPAAAAALPTCGRLDRAAFRILEYLSASNWSLAFNFFQSKLKLLRALPLAASTGPGSLPLTDGGRDPEASALAGLQILAHLWLDRRKLSVVIQELCGCFLNLQKAAQNAIAVLLPETIGRWIDNNPDEFVQLHSLERRLDARAEFLFDMSNSMASDVRLREFLWPLQTSLVLLIPEVFWVAGSMHEAKASLAKKAAFLSSLRQSLRSSRSSNTAAFCLVGICKVAHHFPADSDAALLSYALDVQLEVREEVFRPTVGDDDRTFDLYFMVAVIVSLCHLNQDSVLDHLLPWCFRPDAPTQLRLALFHSCAIMARQPDAGQYSGLFAAVGPHVRALLLQRARGPAAGPSPAKPGRRPSIEPASSTAPSANSGATTATTTTNTSAAAASTVAASGVSGSSGGSTGTGATAGASTAATVSTAATALSATAAAGASAATPTATTPTASSANAEAAEAGSYEVLRTMFDFLAVRPSTLFVDGPSDAIDYNDYFSEGLLAFGPYLSDGDDRLRGLAARIVCRIVAESHKIWTTRRRDSGSDRFLLHHWWRSTSRLLSTLARKALDLGLGGPEVKALVHTIDDFLRARLEVLRLHKTISLASDVGIDIAERSAASVDVETAFLVLLCSSDLAVCASTRRALAVVCDEAALTEDLSDPAHSPLSIVRNYDVYRDLASSHFHLTGLVAFQKRYRRLLLKMARPTRGMLTAWEFVFARWTGLSARILQRRPPPGAELDETALMEWRNYAGFLAALGGLVVSDGPAADGQPAIDQPPAGGDGPSPLQLFTGQCLRLLGAANVRAREAMRDVLATELSPRLYGPLFRGLEEQMADMFGNGDDGGGGAGPAAAVDGRLVFAEQLASLLRAIFERLDDVHEALISPDFGLLGLELAQFLDGLPDDLGTLRVKIKLGQLCEAVTRKREPVKVGHDVRVRNQLLALLLAWMSPPGARPARPADSGRLDTAARVQRDLDRTCLRALVDLTHGLPLQAPEGQSDADASEAKSALYHDYFARFLALLDPDAPGLGNPDDAATTGDLVIAALSNLLSANIDVGLKQTLEIGYHPDRHVRTAFLRVLANILAQEVELERLSDAALADKYNSLLELLLDDVGLTVALCDACPSGEVDEVTYALLNVFESRGMGLVLLQALIEHEVGNTEHEAELLRRNCVATKMLSAYGRWKGAGYLRSTVQQLLRRLILAGDELDLELDPVRMASADDIPRNALQLIYVIKVFVDEICRSLDRVPPLFRRICHLISAAVAARFPNSRFTSVGAFIFLRFFCPAIVAPEAEGLVRETPSKDMRRGLLLIAKVMQNLSNNSPFGVKESYLFPLNDFLSKTIIPVANFQRLLAAPLPAASEMEPLPESFDFGSCVALHRFLFEHWDGVRQKILRRERRSLKDSAAASAAAADAGGDERDGDDEAEETEAAAAAAAPRPPPQQQPARARSAEALGALVAHLGAPAVDMSWNRPSIAANVPPTYSRFQHFMLKNAGRNSDAVISARAVYDGGRAKDGLPVICVILSSVEAEGIDADLLLYCYLKIASRLWHRPFGVLVDATGYHGLGDAADDIFQRLEALSPAELNKNLSKVYVYNMNSAFRKCFRRALRLAGKNEHSGFHPAHVEYRLIGSLQELQLHFHLGPLHLPKNTIAVVNDSRLVFQPVLRLSKTKGKIEVVIKIGGQFVQITTTKKQDIAPGLRMSATVNDIFRIADIDETGPASQADGEHGFGLRTDNGKILMHFSSVRKAEILNALRSAKSKQSKDAKPSKSSERLIRPEDVPGTLLNIALMNLASDEHELRRTAYNLLCSLCRAFHFGLTDQFVAAQELQIPGSSVSIVVGISQRLAASEPQLTADFLGEIFLAWDRLAVAQRPLHVLYMVPWLANLRRHVLSPERDGEKGKERVALIARKLMVVVLEDGGLSTCFQKEVWPVIARDEMVLDILLDEMIKMALAAGAESERTDAIGSIAASLGTVTVQGKVIARLRKMLTRSSLRPTRQLHGNPVWNETCVLLHLCVATSFASKAQSQLFLPELFHIITSVVNTGSASTRLLVHNLMVNTVHSICTAFPLDEARRGKLKKVLASLSEPKTKMLFTLHAGAAGDEEGRRPQQELDNARFGSLQAIVQLMLEVMATGAPTNDMANMWRSRWMSLVASTAFQSNPAIQPRAFAVMGCLAREDVDDDLLYQVLVALRTAVDGYGDEADGELLIAIVTTLTKMMGKLSTTSRYLMQLFWLATSLVRMAPMALFDGAAAFLEAVVQAIAATGEFKDGRMATVLLNGRAGIDTVTAELDGLYGVHFRLENFHFACCASLVKGLTDPVTKDATLRTITSFLEIASASVAEERHYPKDKAILPYHGLVASRATTVDEIREMYWLTGLSPDLGLKSPTDLFAMLELQHITDAELSLHVALSIVNFTSSEDAVQQRILVFLQRVASQRPAVLVQIYEPVASVLDGVLQSSETVETLEAAHALTRTLAADSRFTDASKSSRKMSDVLAEVGMSGIWKNSSFRSTLSQQRKCAVLVGSLIDLIII